MEHRRKRVRDWDAEYPISDAPNDGRPLKKFRSKKSPNDSSSHSLFFALPSELRHAIFNLLSLRDLIHAQLVCASWLSECWNCRITLDFVSEPLLQRTTDEYIDYLLRNCCKPKWVELYLTDCHQITDNALINLSKAQNLQVISLQECKISDKGLMHLTQLPKLEQLKLHGRQVAIAPEQLSILGKLTNLQVLALDKMDITTADDHLEFFSKLTRLFWISIEAPSITGQVFQYMSGLSELNYLDVGFCGLQDQYLQHLTHLTTIYALSLSKNKSISDQGMQYLTSLYNLSRLDISMCSAINNLGFLASFTNLRKLKREFVPSMARDFPPLPILGSLNILLEFNDYREDGSLDLSPLCTNLVSLSKLKIQLPELDMPVDRDMNQISHLTQLRVLELDFPPTGFTEAVTVTDCFFAGINATTNLRKLELINDFKYFGNMQRLLQQMTHLRKLLIK